MAIFIHFFRWTVPSEGRECALSIIRAAHPSTISEIETRSTSTVPLPYLFLLFRLSDCEQGSGILQGHVPLGPLPKKECLLVNRTSLSLNRLGQTIDIRITYVSVSGLHWNVILLHRPSHRDVIIGATRSHSIAYSLLNVNIWASWSHHNVIPLYNDHIS